MKPAAILRHTAMVLGLMAAGLLTLGLVALSWFAAMAAFLSWGAWTGGALVLRLAYMAGFFVTVAAVVLAWQRLARARFASAAALAMLAAAPSATYVGLVLGGAIRA